MPQDPFAQFRIGDSKPVDTPKEDPFAKFRANKVEEQPKIETRVEEPIANRAEPQEEQGWLDWLITSILPDKLTDSGVNFDSKNPRNPGRSIVEPDTYAGGFAKGLQESLYGDVVKPMGSPLGAAMTVAGGPITRGVLKGASKIPGVSKIGELLSKDVLPGEAPEFVKKTVQSLAPKGADEIVPPIDPEGQKLADELLKIQEASTPLGKFRVALEQNKPLSKQQRDLLTVERSQKFGDAKKVDVTDTDSAKNFMSKFKGEHTKIVGEPLKLEQPDVDSLMGMIGENLKAGKLSTPEGAQSITAFNKLLEGAALQNNEIQILSRTFGPELMAEAAKSSTAREWLMKNISIPKALFSALDVGWPLRQGVNRAGSMNWNKAVWDSLKAYSSEGRSKELIEELQKAPRFDFWRQNGLEIYDNVKTTGIEHSLNSRVQNFLPVKMGNRAFNAGMSRLRLNDANDLYNDYDTMYKSALDLAKSNPNKELSKQLIKEAELHNPENELVAKQISDLVNTGTGYGDIGKLKAIAEEANATFFSPSLISSRLRSIHRVLNPASYVNKDPVQRKYALKQLLSLTGSIVGLGTALKSAGAEVELDPASSDFLTAKFDKTRVDLTGGYRGYLVAPYKILSGTAKSTRSGETNELNTGEFGSPTKFDVLENFVIGKEAPIPSLITSYLRGIKPTGEKVDFTNPNPMDNTAAEAAIPGILQTLYEISEEDPNLLPLMGLSALGSNVGVYKDKEKKGGGR